jgi:uncharacterized protein (UPF0276 family)
MNDFPFLGHGIGLRRDHSEELAERRADVGFLELISENYMVPGGNPLRVLCAVRERYPIVLHGVSMSLGATDPIDPAYLNALERLIEQAEPAWVSDHLCWSSYGGHAGHDLWPLPMTEESLAHVVRRVQAVQDRLRRRILIENVSSYVTFTHSTLSEWEFLSEVARRADCGILLDVNNVYVSAHNHGFDAARYIDALPAERIGQIHLAGHSDHGTHLLDTHDHPVTDAVWRLYRRAVARFGAVSTLIEWDDHIPPLARLIEEAHAARAIDAEVRREGAVAHAV